MTALVNDRMKNKGFTDDDIAYVNGHLRENIESYQLKHFKSVDVSQQKLVINPSSFKTEDISFKTEVTLCAKDKELENKENSRLLKEIFTMLRLLFESDSSNRKIQYALVITIEQVA